MPPDGDKEWPWTFLDSGSVICSTELVSWNKPLGSTYYKNCILWFSWWTATPFQVSKVVPASISDNCHCSLFCQGISWLAEVEGNFLAFTLVSNIDLLYCLLQRGDSATAIQYLGNNLWIPDEQTWQAKARQNTVALHYYWWRSSNKECLLQAQCWTETISEHPPVAFDRNTDSSKADIDFSNTPWESYFTYYL